MTSDELADAVFWERMVCIECEAIFAPSATSSFCPECGADAAFHATDLARVEAWLATLERE
jgi:rRNA maturation endonuclease Nob1